MNSPSIFQVDKQQNESQEETNAADDDVSVAKEWIFTAKNRCRRENEELSTFELLHWII